MSGPRFEVGDRVRCVRGYGCYGWYLYAGATYVVGAVSKFDTIQVAGVAFWWDTDRFVPVPKSPPRDLDPFEWNLEQAWFNCGGGNTADMISAFARWLWAVTGLPFTFGDTPDTVTVELPRGRVDHIMQVGRVDAYDEVAVIDACRAALGGDS